MATHKGHVLALVGVAAVLLLALMLIPRSRLNPQKEASPSLAERPRAQAESLEDKSRLAATKGSTIAESARALPGAPAPDEATSPPASRSPVEAGQDPREGDPSALRQAPLARWALDAEGIKGAIRASLPEIRECYEEWLKVNQDLGGKIVTRFTVSDDPKDPAGGQVSDVSIGDGTLDHPALEGCVLNVLQGMSFERPVGGQLKVSYPIVFESATQDGGTGP